MSTIPLTGVLSSVLLIVAATVAAALVGILTRGRVRVLGVIGFSAFVVERLIGLGWVLAAPRLLNSLSVPISVVASAYSALRALLSLVAILLLAFAVIVDRTRPPQPPADRY